MQSEEDDERREKRCGQKGEKNDMNNGKVSIDLLSQVVKKGSQFLTFITELNKYQQDYIFFHDDNS